ncbi:hypothetical protein [Kutzneria albida]|uniref:Uncharacterized protein n=1 Tax=Kutzneria albida DSM 43870 TaxID=1449976 RepID=W5WCS1_9PSEU|nr:hypothetical protein [Kutzneria albida]AHH98963.1 hypothetical protein KALB_5601 [Kutzneria albida DSM 43870]
MHLIGWLSLRTELILSALRTPSFRDQLADRERIARDAHTASITATFDALGVTPPADPAFLALIVHTLEADRAHGRPLLPN